MSKAIILAAVVALFSSPMHALAQNRCPAGNSGCTMDNAAEKIRDRINEGAQNVVTNPDSRGRVKEVGETLRDCLNCGKDALLDGMNQVTGGNGTIP